MPPVPTPKQTPKQQVSSLSWKLNNLETKARINEQNILNDRRHVQIMNRNILDLKKEFRDKLDKIMTERHDVTKKVSDLEVKVKNMERRVKRFVKKEEISAMKKFHESFNYFDTQMTKEEADNILDDIVKKAEE